LPVERDIFHIQLVRHHTFDEQRIAGPSIDQRATVDLCDRELVNINILKSLEFNRVLRGVEVRDYIVA